MNTLKKKAGVYYTQNVRELPIEERVFFREGTGVSATGEYYRIATQEEIAAWEDFKRKKEEELNAITENNDERNA